MCLNVRLVEEERHKLALTIIPMVGEAKAASYSATIVPPFCCMTKHLAPGVLPPQEGMPSVIIAVSTPPPTQHTYQNQIIYSLPPLPTCDKMFCQIMRSRAEFNFIKGKLGMHGYSPWCQKDWRHGLFIWICSVLCRRKHCSGLHDWFPRVDEPGWVYLD